jgi:hypothetical protein
MPAPHGSKRPFQMGAAASGGLRRNGACPARAGAVEACPAWAHRRVPQRYSIVHRSAQTGETEGGRTALTHGRITTGTSWSIPELHYEKAMRMRRVSVGAGVSVLILASFGTASCLLRGLDDLQWLGPDAGIGEAGSQNAPDDDGGGPPVTDGGRLGDTGSLDAEADGGGAPPAGALGAPCTAASQCEKGFCVDGVCCDSACKDHICQRCDRHSVSGAGYCDAAEEGTDLEGECSSPIIECLGKCYAMKTTYICTGSSYNCGSRQETVPVPSGQICIAGKSTGAIVLVNKDAFCNSGNDCADGKCQASRWWTSCDGNGACRDANDRVDAKVEMVIVDPGKAMTAACGTGGTGGTTACGAIGAVCSSGQCTCPASTTVCSGACVMKAKEGGNCYAWTNDTVKDYKTGLVWQRGGATQTYGWAGSASYCSGLNLGGFSSGWRLPSLDELKGILDLSRSGPPYIDTDAFPDSFSAYWTSTPYAGSSGSAWYVNFENGLSSYYSVTSFSVGVRCVR